MHQAANAALALHLAGAGILTWTGLLSLKALLRRDGGACGVFGMRIAWLTLLQLTSGCVLAFLSPDASVRTLCVNGGAYLAVTAGIELALLRETGRMRVLLPSFAGPLLAGTILVGGTAAFLTLQQT